MTRILDPALAFPQKDDLYSPEYWDSLMLRIGGDRTSGGNFKLGPSTYKEYVRLVDQILDMVGTSMPALSSYIVRLSSALTDPDPENDVRLTKEQIDHVLGSYTAIAESDQKYGNKTLSSSVADLLANDLVKSSSAKTQIGTFPRHWGQCDCGVACRFDPQIEIDLEFDSTTDQKSRRYGTSPSVVQTPPYPFDECVACRHDSCGNHYAQDGATDLWWTHDFARHGGTHFKSYRLVGRTLQFNHDHTATGEVIHKHKGPIGYRINLSKLTVCNSFKNHPTAK